MNLGVQFRRLLPADPLQRGQVLTTSASSSTVQLPGGAVVRVRGTATVGAQVFIRAGVIEGLAPTFTPTTLEV